MVKIILKKFDFLLIYDKKKNSLFYWKRWIIFIKCNFIKLYQVIIYMSSEKVEELRPHS